MKKLFPYLLILFFIQKMIFLSGCANIIPPMGGPRDSLPPVLVNANPKDSTRNFSSNKITLTFNEFVELNNLTDNLVVSPNPKYPTAIEAHLRTVTIRIKDTLEPNTTYSINFGRAIRDINEGNELKNFTYIFSTGNKFDSLEFSGKVVIAETGKADSTLIVMLYKNLDDSAVIKDRPRYYTRLDSSGNFRFRNLPPGTFAVYALKDEGGLKKYLSKKRLFAFADHPVQIPENTSPITLYAYAEVKDSSNQPKNASTKTPQDKVLRIQTNLDNGLLDLGKNLEIQFEKSLKFFDPSKVRFTDASFNNLGNQFFQLDPGRKKLILQYGWTSNTTYHIIANKDFAEDSLGRRLLRVDTLSFRTKKESDYATLKLRFINLDLSKHPVLQFVQGDQVKYSYVFKDRNVNIPLFPPGDYDLRILYDENQNGKWDAGLFFGKHMQPEKVQPIARKLTAKVNWDTIVDITL